MYENWIEELDGTSIEYLPSRSVIVPLVVPACTTLTPMSGSLLETSTTLPVTLTFCANNAIGINIKGSINSNALKNFTFVFIKTWLN